jgi:SET family sugar efflux transporter-like MFS transporter
LGVLQVISIAPGIYPSTMILLGSASEAWHFIVLTILSAARAAALLAMPVSYFQDLFAAGRGLVRRSPPSTRSVPTA